MHQHDADMCCMWMYQSVRKLFAFYFRRRQAVVMPPVSAPLIRWAQRKHLALCSVNFDESCFKIYHNASLMRGNRPQCSNIKYCYSNTWFVEIFSLGDKAGTCRNAPFAKARFRRDIDNNNYLRSRICKL